MRTGAGLGGVGRRGAGSPRRRRALHGRNEDEDLPYVVQDSRTSNYWPGVFGIRDTVLLTVLVAVLSAGPPARQRAAVPSVELMTRTL